MKSFDHACSEYNFLPIMKFYSILFVLIRKSIQINEIVDKEVLWNLKLLMNAYCMSTKPELIRVQYLHQASLTDIACSVANQPSV